MTASDTDGTWKVASDQAMFGGPRTEGGYGMKRSTGLMTVAALALALTAVQAKQHKTPDATIALHGGSIAAGIGISWGSGTLTYKGKDYPIDVKGLSIGDVGATSIEA